MRDILATITLIAGVALSQDRAQFSAAEAVWEQPIQARGGREAIARVQNLLVLSSDRHGPQFATLIVVPGFLWSWMNRGVTGGGAYTQAFDLITKRKCSVGCNTRSFER